MAIEEYLVPAEPAPNLRIPASKNTVSVRVIDSTARIQIGINLIVQPHIKGHDIANCPAFSFLITHGLQNRNVLFDLGIRKDWENLPPLIVKRVKENGWKVSIEKHVAEILDDTKHETGVGRNDVEAVIWSHHHWDHTGDMGTFSPHTSLIVGPGLREQYPTYPSNPDGTILDSDFAGRTVREVEFNSGLQIGRFKALDFFGDGSFYLLDTPGHAFGHLCGLARVSAEPSTFIFMGGDACHHSGEFRPTKYRPLPSSIIPSPFNQGALAGRACPGEVLQNIHPRKSANQPYYDPTPFINTDAEEAVHTIRKVEEFDAQDDVFVIMAHDDSLLGHIDEFPNSIDGWLKKDNEDFIVSELYFGIVV